MKRLIPLFVGIGIGALSLASPLSLHAATKTLTWDPVTKCTDNTNCTPEKYTMYRQAGPTAAFVKLADIVPPLVTYTDAAAPVGAICWRVTASSVLNGESAPSNVLCATIAPPALNPPQDLR